MLTPVFGDDTVAETRGSSPAGSVDAARCPPADRQAGIRHPADDGVLADPLARSGAERRDAILTPPAEPAPTLAFQARVSRAATRGRRRLDCDERIRSARGPRRRPAPDTARHRRTPPRLRRVPLALLGEHRRALQHRELLGARPEFWARWESLVSRRLASRLLGRLGYEGPRRTSSSTSFLQDSGLIEVVVDDHPSSETVAIREYTDDHRELHRVADRRGDDVARRGHREEGFTGDVSPHALLYLYLRHALLLGYYDTSYQLHKSAGFLAPELRCDEA